MNQVRRTYRTVLHPRIKTARDRSMTMHDYISVPRLTLIGTFPLLDMLSNQSLLNLHYAYENAR